MGDPTASNVSLGKPHGKNGRFAGGMWWALKSAVTDANMPKDATTALPDVFKGGGYLGDDGITNTVDTETTSLIAFGGDEVASETTSRSESFQFPMWETTEDTLGLVYGPDNVTVSGTGAQKTITVKHNGKEQPELVLVFELALTGNRVKRIVVPDGKMGELDDVQYTNGEVVAYTPTIRALPDADGNTAYEYIATVGSSAPASGE